MDPASSVVRLLRFLTAPIGGAIREPVVLPPPVTPPRRPPDPVPAPVILEPGVLEGGPEARSADWPPTAPDPTPAPEPAHSLVLRSDRLADLPRLGRISHLPGYRLHDRLRIIPGPADPGRAQDPSFVTVQELRARLGQVPAAAPASPTPAASSPDPGASAQPPPPVDPGAGEAPAAAPVAGWSVIPMITKIPWRTLAPWALLALVLLPRPGPVPPRSPPAGTAPTPATVSDTAQLGEVQDEIESRRVTWSRKLSEVRAALEDERMRPVRLSFRADELYSGIPARPQGRARGFVLGRREPPVLGPRKRSGFAVASYQDQWVPRGESQALVRELDLKW